MSAFSRTIRPYRPLITSASILLISLLGLFVGVVPLIRTTWDMASQVGPLREEVAVLEEKESALLGMDQAEIEENLNELLLAVPQDKSVSTLFSTIEGMAGMSGVSIGDIAVVSPGSIATSAATRQTAEERQLGSGLLPFTLSLEGSLAQVREFLSLTGKVRRLSRVRTFAISVRDDGSVRTTLDMDAFWLPFPAAIGKVAQRISPLTQAQLDLVTRVIALDSFPAFNPVSATFEEELPQSAIKSDPFAP